jgi:hypothetical protein
MRPQQETVVQSLLTSTIFSELYKIHDTAKPMENDCLRVTSELNS